MGKQRMTTKITRNLNIMNTKNKTVHIFGATTIMLTLNLQDSFD